LIASKLLQPDKFYHILIQLNLTSHVTTGILHGMLKPPNLIVTKNLDWPIDSTAHTLNNRSIKQFLSHDATRTR